MRQEADESGKALLSLIRGKTAMIKDWQAFRELASHHGLLGLVYPLLGSAEARAALFSDYADQAANTVTHMAFLSRVRENAPSFLPLKGAALVARGLYLPQERPLLDLDILVRPGDVPVFVNFLSREGFSPVPIRNPKGLVMHRRKMNIDLHTHPFGRDLHILSRKLWARSRDGFLSPEDDLLVIAVHAAKSSFTFGPRLIWKLDAERLLPLVDVRKALDLARSAGLENCLLRMLRAKDEDIIRGQRRPGRLRKLRLAWGAGANKGQKVVCISAAGWERLMALCPVKGLSPRD